MSDVSPAHAGKSPKATKSTAMTFACEAHQLVAEIAGTQALGGRIKTALGMVARRTGLSERRIRGIWHMEARAIRAEELDALRRAAHAQQKAELDAEISELRARLARLQEEIAMAGPTVFGGTRAAESREMGPQGRVVDSGRLTSPTGPRMGPMSARS